MNIRENVWRNYACSGPMVKNTGNTFIRKWIQIKPKRIKRLFSTTTITIKFESEGITNYVGKCQHSYWLKVLANMYRRDRNVQIYLGVTLYIMFE